MKLPRNSWWLLLLLLLGSSSSRSAAVTADDDDDDVPPPTPPTPPTPPKPAPDFDCDEDSQYLYLGTLTVPGGGVMASGLEPDEYQAAMTVLTRVINEAYVPRANFPTGGANLCTMKRVASHARVVMTKESSALAMLAYWHLRQRPIDPGEKLSPHPKVDPALAGVTMMDQRTTWEATYNRLRTFMVRAWTKPQA